VIALELIFQARKIFYGNFSDQIQSSWINTKNYSMKIQLRKSILVYIRYNNYNQYSYVIQFSRKKYDRIRFDNYDDRWPVKTAPHHCHPRNSKNAIESNFIGDPNLDMNTFIEVLKPYFT
jgi:hypothetical protein